MEAECVYANVAEQPNTVASLSMLWGTRMEIGQSLPIPLWNRSVEQHIPAPTTVARTAKQWIFPHFPTRQHGQLKTQHNPPAR